MDKIDKYINSIYKDISNTSKETEDLKQEMRSHLVETGIKTSPNTNKNSFYIGLAILSFAI